MVLNALGYIVLNKKHTVYYIFVFRLEATAVVVLNALGYIGFKVITTCGDTKVQSMLGSRSR